MGAAKTDACSHPALPLTSYLVSKSSLTPNFCIYQKGLTYVTGCLLVNEMKGTMEKYRAQCLAYSRCPFIWSCLRKLPQRYL